MSICDSNVQQEFAMCTLAAKIDAAQEEYIKKIENDEENKDDSFHKLSKPLKEYRERFNQPYVSQKEDIVKDNNFFSAKAARKYYDKVIESDNTELESVFKNIKEAIFERKQNYCYVNSLTDITKKKLEKLGYEVSYAQNYRYLIQF